MNEFELRQMNSDGDKIKRFKVENFEKQIFYFEPKNGAARKEEK